MNHKMGQWVFAISVGLLVAFGAYRWASDPGPRLERALQEQVVRAARAHLRSTIGIDDLELVDPLVQNRKVGKAYVYRDGSGWEVSGFYRRGDDDPWHPWLMSLDSSQAMIHLKIQDDSLEHPGAATSVLEVLPDAIRKH